MNKRVAWTKQHSLRQQAIKEANNLGLKGKDYSNYMIKFDTVPTTKGVF